jgi:hypothetical protein
MLKEQQEEEMKEQRIEEKRAEAKTLVARAVRIDSIIIGNIRLILTGMSRTYRDISEVIIWTEISDNQFSTSKKNQNLQYNSKTPIKLEISYTKLQIQILYIKLQISYTRLSKVSNKAPNLK